MNEYSSQWFDLFLNGGDPPHTRREADYLVRMLPLPQFRRVLDVCCGTGRHARVLDHLGYEVTGVDRDEHALERARSTNHVRATFRQWDMRQLRNLNGAWDAAVIMWASFGYFEPAVNRSVLRDLAALLRPGGRIILDLYNRDHFDSQPQERTLTIRDTEVREIRRQLDGRLNVSLKYPDGGAEDQFSWEVFTPAELGQLGSECGLDLFHVCAGFDETVSPTASLPRMQAVFIRQV